MYCPIIILFTLEEVKAQVDPFVFSHTFFFLGFPQCLKTQREQPSWSMLAVNGLTEVNQQRNLSFEI